MRREYELTDEQHAKLLDACKPTPAMWGRGGMPMFKSPQENANAAWADIGREMGFDSMTVRPVAGKSSRYFTADSTRSMAHTEATVAPLAKNAVIATTFSMPAEGIVQFNISVKVNAQDFAGWSPDRITAFFGGIAQVLAAKGALERDASA